MAQHRRTLPLLPALYGTTPALPSLSYLHYMAQHQRYPAQEAECDGEGETGAVVVVVVEDTCLHEVQQAVAGGDLEGEKG